MSIKEGIPLPKLCSTCGESNDDPKGTVTEENYCKAGHVLNDDGTCIYHFPNSALIDTNLEVTPTP